MNADRTSHHVTWLVVHSFLAGANRVVFLVLDQPFRWLCLAATAVSAYRAGKTAGLLDGLKAP